MLEFIVDNFELFFPGEEEHTAKRATWLFRKCDFERKEKILEIYLKELLEQKEELEKKIFEARMLIYGK